MNINLNLYKHFYEVAKYCSFTKASEKTLISQPSLSYSVKTLENQLDVKLFFKTKSKIFLTEEGKIIYEKLEKIFSELDNILVCNNKEYKEDLIVAGRLAYITNVATPKLIEFNKIYPNISVHFKVRDKIEMEDLLNKNKIDLVLDNYKYNKNNENSIHVFLEEPKETIFIASKKFEKKFENTLIDESYISNNSIVITPGNSYGEELYENYLENKFIKVQSTKMLLEYLEENPVVGHSIPLLVQKYIDNDKYIIVKNNMNMPKAGPIATYNKGNDSYGLKKFIEFIKAN